MENKLELLDKRQDGDFEIKDPLPTLKFFVERDWLHVGMVLKARRIVWLEFPDIIIF